MIRKIGYACINLSLDCRSSRTFRLVSYSEERLAETIKGNLNCLQQILEFNLKKQIYFFRITSDLIPFASHPVNQFPWQRVFKQQFKEIGRFISSKGMRVSLHPGQFTILNSPRKEVVKNARRELIYHNQVLDLMGLNSSHKIQIHVGGVYGNKQSARLRFEKNFQCLPHSVKNRLVIENDDRSFSLADCLKTSSKLRIPIVLDSLHHSLLHPGEA